MNTASCHSTNLRRVRVEASFFWTAPFAVAGGEEGCELRVGRRDGVRGRERRERCLCWLCLERNGHRR